MTKRDLMKLVEECSFDVSLGETPGMGQEIPERLNRTDKEWDKSLAKAMKTFAKECIADEIVLFYATGKHGKQGIIFTADALYCDLLGGKDNTYKDTRIVYKEVKRVSYDPRSASSVYFTYKDDQKKMFYLGAHAHFIMRVFENIIDMLARVEVEEAAIDRYAKLVPSHYDPDNLQKMADAAFKECIKLMYAPNRTDEQARRAVELLSAGEAIGHEKSVEYIANRRRAFREGSSCDARFDEVVKTWENGAEAGSPDCMFRAALELYEYGYTVSHMSRARDWAKRADHKGRKYAGLLVKAIDIRKRKLETNPLYEMFLKAARNYQMGSADEKQTAIGEIVYCGDQGLVDALYWFVYHEAELGELRDNMVEMAAKCNHPEALFVTAMNSKDLREKRDYLEKAMAAGSQFAYYHYALGLIMEDYGLGQDLEEAERMIEKAKSTVYVFSRNLCQKIDELELIYEAIVDQRRDDWSSGMDKLGRALTEYNSLNAKYLLDVFTVLSQRKVHNVNRWKETDVEKMLKNDPSMLRYSSGKVCYKVIEACTYTTVFTSKTDDFKEKAIYYGTGKADYNCLKFRAEQVKMSNEAEYQELNKLITRMTEVMELRKFEGL